MGPKSNHLSEHEHERQKREEGLDKTLADSFPSSDPPSTIPDPMADETTEPTDLPETKGEPAQGMLGTADKAFRATAQSYLDRAGINFDLRQLENAIRKKPLLAAASAAGAGFLVGGGMGTQLGATMLAFFGRKAARDTASNLISGVVQSAVR